MSELVRYSGRESCGTDVPSAQKYAVFHGDRINDHHTTLADKSNEKGRN